MKAKRNKGILPLEDEECDSIHKTTLGLGADQLTCTNYGQRAAAVTA